MYDVEKFAELLFVFVCEIQSNETNEPASCSRQK